MCDEKIGASVGTTPKAHAPARTSNLNRHLGRLHLEIFKLVQEEDKCFAWNTNRIKY